MGQQHFEEDVEGAGSLVLTSTESPKGGEVSCGQELNPVRVCCGLWWSWLLLPLSPYPGSSGLARGIGPVGAA